MIRSLAAMLLCASLTAAQDSFEDICARFADYDHNGDGVVEIDSIDPWHAAGPDAPVVLVLVEPRLLESLEGAEQLTPRIERMVDDLGREGWRAHAALASLGDADLHQDGRYVLALREFLRAVRSSKPLAGVVLVGRFPDAFIVRTCNWRRNGDLTLHKKTDRQAAYSGRYVRRVPEDVAHRADIVLSDLDGRWEDVYIQAPTRLQKVHAFFGDSIPKRGGACLDVEVGTVGYRDFFHVSDGKLEISEQNDGWWVTLFDETGDHECSAPDRARGPNVLAHPEILVSRIDARGTALRPRPEVVGEDGAGLLDEQGRPRSVSFASSDETPHWREGVWEADPVLERTLLAEYFDRNHAYRTGEADIVRRPASIACDLGSGFRIMASASKSWEEGDPALADIKGRPTLQDFVAWMQYPAVLRTVRAHSDHWGSVFRKSDVAALEAAIGSPAWAWTPTSDGLTPSLRAACGGGKLDWFLLRTLWEHDAIAPEPSFYHHTGCHGISPPGAKSRPYDDPSYGVRQGAEALLFFGNGLALVGRAKVFYDEPKGFAEALRDGATFGEAWSRYFEIESDAASWGKAGGDIGRKRSYFWSVLGDWTLRLNAPGPLSRLGP